MITFHYKVNPKQKRRDGTMNVKIIVTYKRQRKMLPTSIYCTQHDITRGGKLKNQAYIDKVEALIREYQRRASALGLEFQELSLADIVGKLTDRTSTDFFVFAEKVVKERQTERTRASYTTAINWVEKFIGRRPLGCQEMTKNFFLRFEAFLGERHGGLTSGDCIIINHIRAIYRQAQLHFNDENNEVISSYPLVAYTPPHIPSNNKRALPIEKIREIMNVKPATWKDEVCRDLFVLSFCLMGMNAIDMYNADHTSDEKICYNRTKTKSRRMDNAYMEVWIDPRVRQLVNKYRGHRKQFYFAERMTERQFTYKIGHHMAAIGRLVGLEGLTFYAARHSFATIAYNDCGIDKYVVHAALNHVPKEMRITDVYIQRTFEKENEANRKVLDLLFQQDCEC